MKIIATAGALFAATLATAAGAQVSLNSGSFEEIGQLYSPAIGGLYEASGWVNTSGLNIQASSALAGVEGTPADAATGARFLRLVSDNPDPQNTGSIYQNLGTIVAGRSYTITGDAFGGDSINNLWGGLFSLSSGASVAGDVYAATGVAGLARGASTSFSFGFNGTRANAGQSVFLNLSAIPSGPGQDIRGGVDNLQLSVAGVPEPAAWATMIGGLGLVGGVARRRRVKIAFA